MWSMRWSTVAGSGRKRGWPQVATAAMSAREPGVVRIRPETVWVPVVTPWTPWVTTATWRWPITTTGTPSVTVVHGRLISIPLPGASSQESSTVPSIPSTRRASSVHGSGPARPMFSDSVTRTVPSVVATVVSSTLVRGRYRRCTSGGRRPMGCKEKCPPAAGSSRAAQMGGVSRAGAAHQSMRPSPATSATERPSPSRP